MRHLIAFLSALGVAVAANAATYTSSGADTGVNSVQAIHDDAGTVDGDIIEIPAGNFTWPTGVTITKGVHIRGAGSGRVVARSASSVSIGTGSKSFIVTRDTTSQTAYAFTPNETLTIERLTTARSGGNPTGTRTYFTGTVNSFNSGTGELVMDITSTGGSGTHGLWIVITPAATTIQKNITNGVMIAVSEDATHHVEISGIKQTWAGGVGNVIQMTGTDGKAIIVRDCLFELINHGAGQITIYTNTKKGLVYNCSFVAWPTGTDLNGDQAFQSRRAENTWSSISTMGAADTTGLNNFYIENCDFHGIQNSTDCDNNTKAVVRYCTLNNAGLGTHGPDTSDFGMRHFEVYNCEFLFNGFSDGHTVNLNYFFYWRGGTGVVYNNTLTDINSQDYSNKAEIKLQIQNLGRNAGPNPLWSDNDGQVPQRHVPRQVGYGYINGSGRDGLGREFDTTGYFVGDLEPIYVWGNTGTLSIAVDVGYAEGINADLATDYIRAGFEYVNDGTAKPGWTAYTYPHPLRAAATENPRHTPRNARGLGVSRRR